MSLGHNAYDKRYGKGDQAGKPVVTGVDVRFERHYIMIEFYKDEAMTQQVSTADLKGTVVIKVGRNNRQFTIEKGSIVLGTPTYDIPNAMGSYDSYHIDVTGVTDFGEANYYKLLVNVYGD